jgi:hypothetical protein
MAALLEQGRVIRLLIRDLPAQEAQQHRFPIGVRIF